MTLAEESLDTHCCQSLCGLGNPLVRYSKTKRNIGCFHNNFITRDSSSIICFSLYLCTAAERIAVEYLLAQSNKGDLLSPPGNEIGATSTEPLEDQDEECHDVTIPCASDIYSYQGQSSQVM